MTTQGACSSLARDVDILQQGGYTVRTAAPFDMFPRTGHVVTAALLSRVEG